MNAQKKNLLELINKFFKVARCKINIQKQVVFLYTSNDKPENGIKKIISFIRAPKRISS